MADEEEFVPAPFPDDAGDTAPERARRRWGRVLLLAIGVLLAVAIAVAWFSRNRIADDVIRGQLAGLGIEATYEVERIGVDSQVLRNVVIGNPAKPDLTVERLVVATLPRFGVPAIGRITAVKPRLFGSYRDGKLSFGSLDKVLFEGPKKQRFQLPDLDVAIVDGRGRLDTDFGPVGFKLAGNGRLRGGFAGVLAAVAPKADIAGCHAERASIYGSLAIRSERPHFAGPLRLGSLACPAPALQLGASDMLLDATADAALDGGEGKLSFKTAGLRYDTASARTATLDASFAYRKRALNLRYTLGGGGIAAPQVRMAGLAVSGGLRSMDGFARIDVDGDVTGRSIDLGNGLDATLADFQRSAEGSFGAPLLAQLRAGLARQAPGSSVAGSFAARRTGSITNLVVPQASLSGGHGEVLLALSRLQITADSLSPARISGNFSTGGVGLPKIAGRMERNPAGGLALRATMAEYASGTSRLALPELVLIQSRSGALGFAGTARMSGPLPGGAARNLILPLEGNWSASRGLAMWRKCTTLSFDRLAYANLTLQRRTLTLCPQSAGAILASDSRGTRIAAGAPSLDLAGSLGATPIRIVSGPVGFAMPGMLAARSLDIALGPAASASHFRITNLDARIGKDVAGRFADADVLLSGVPLDVRNASGSWRYAGGRLTIAGAEMRVEDRQADDRFLPLVSHDGELQLADNLITARATLLEPASQRQVLRTTIRHDLASGTGAADLLVDNLVFDKGLQPDTLTRLALGVVANVTGGVRGQGRIDWNPRTTTSTGRFTTDGLDFAAAFGPASGVSGTVEFSDLLGLVTAPDQRLKIASINPGIEATEGELVFELRPDSVLAIKGARWPFMGGALTLEPTRMQFGVAETRRYTLRIEGLDAAKFVTRMELANISATGTFDGSLPLVFDENGGTIQGGHLVSRPPGGNVSYVGALTYKDLSAMANFAFDTLKSLNYKQMNVDLDGALEGELVTRVTFDGVSQGVGAKSNFLTKRIAKLPIRFRVNIRAPFFQLVRSFRSLYDPAFVRDPRELGLIDVQGRPLPALPPGAPPAVAPTVQPSDSEKQR